LPHKFLFFLPEGNYFSRLLPTFQTGLQRNEIILTPDRSISLILGMLCQQNKQNATTGWWKYLVLCCLLICSLRAAAQLQPIGDWREHLPYGNTVALTASADKIYAATPFAIFSIDPSDNTIERQSKVTGLSEVGVSTIAYDQVNEQLLIAYTNSNIDIIGRNKMVNIPDIKRKVINGDKSIYDIFFYDKKAYLSAGLGIIVVDEEKNEIKDTYYIGDNGGFVKVNGFTEEGSFFYAATAEGLKRAPKNAANLADYRNWVLLSAQNGLPAGECRQILNAQGTMIALVNETLYILNGNNWLPLYTDDWQKAKPVFSGNKITLCEQKPTGESRVLVINPAGGLVEKTILQPGVISAPQQAIVYKGDYWIADFFGGLSQFTGSGFSRFIPNGPLATASGEMIVTNDQLWVAAGEVNESWNYQYNRNGFYRFSDNEWANFNRSSAAPLDTLPDFITLATDPRNQTLYAGSYGGGLLALAANGAISIYKQNTGLEPAIGDPTSYRVSGLCFDADNNLWIANYGAPQNVVVRKADGSWRSFSIPFFHIENAVSQVLVDDNNQKWVVSPKNNGLFCFNHGASVDNPGDDRWKFYRAGRGAGNLPDNNVLCIAKDKDGFIWVGTSRGIGVIQCPGDAFTGQGCEAILPIVQQDRFAGFLFQGDEVRSIAVDGANRKWVATKNGVWLISADGEKLITHFTEEDSPLLSNDVKQITINGSTGEVFFATFKGICSFRSTATEGSEKNTDVLVFPNPVPPGYKGTIAIKGLVNNAIVKITALDGRLVYQTRALGGQAVWNGKDYKGRPTASGAYLVVVSDETRTEKVVTKIFMTAQ
jgi:Two component regulator propeller